MNLNISNFVIFLLLSQLLFHFLSILWIIVSTQSYLIWFIMALLLMPGVAAQGEERPFPDIPFRLFSSFVKENFSSKITLSQVLLVLFTITHNPDLLNLHARQ